MDVDGARLAYAVDAVRRLVLDGGAEPVVYVYDVVRRHEVDAVAAGEDAAERLERRLKRLIEEYGLASRACSLVAVVKRGGDKPGEVPKTRSTCRYA